MFILRAESSASPDLASGWMSAEVTTAATNVLTFTYEFDSAGVNDVPGESWLSVYVDRDGDATFTDADLIYNKDELVASRVATPDNPDGTTVYPYTVSIPLDVDLAPGLRRVAFRIDAQERIDDLHSGTQSELRVSTVVFGTGPTSPPAGVPVPIRTMHIRPAKIFRFTARGTIPLPDPAFDDPRQVGASLRFGGATGGQTYELPPSCWRGLGPDRNGARGFKCRDAACERVVVKADVIRATCKLDTGDFGPLPEAGPVDVELSIGTTRYCGECGGTPKGKPSTQFKRTDCPVPVVCP
jgi:hypothetical protein